MKEQHVTLPSGTLSLEGLLAKPDGLKPVRGAVVCHPHPLYGGSMYNNVVDAVLAAMWKQEWATLRFNFRGVGESEGEHGGGAGEAEDAAAAISFLTSQSGIRRDGAVLAGYSFGSVAAMTAAPKLKNLGGLVLVALPLKMADVRALNDFAGPIASPRATATCIAPCLNLKRYIKSWVRAHNFASSREPTISLAASRSNWPTPSSRCSPVSEAGRNLKRGATLHFDCVPAETLVR